MVFHYGLDLCFPTPSDAEHLFLALSAIGASFLWNLVHVSCPSFCWVDWVYHDFVLYMNIFSILTLVRCDTASIFSQCKIFSLSLDRLLKNQNSFLKFFSRPVVDVQCCVSFCCIERDSVIHRYILFHIFSLGFNHRILNIFPVLYSRTFVVHPFYI